MRLTVNGKPSSWSDSTCKLWTDNVVPLFQEGEHCSSANYFTPRPYKNEYDRGSDKEGFVYVVQPGFRVCLWERTANGNR